MRSLIYRVSLCEVYFYNCVECGVPLHSEAARKVGLCGRCGMGGKSRHIGKPGRKEAAQQAWLKENSDPYGQPVVVNEVS